MISKLSFLKTIWRAVHGLSLDGSYPNHCKCCRSSCSYALIDASLLQAKYHFLQHLIHGLKCMKQSDLPIGLQIKMNGQDESWNAHCGVLMKLDLTTIFKVSLPHKQKEGWRLMECQGAFEENFLGQCPKVYSTPFFSMVITFHVDPLSAYEIHTHIHLILPMLKVKFLVVSYSIHPYIPKQNAVKS